MTIFERFANAYSYGGLKEIIRKSTTHAIYRINNFATKRKVDSRYPEYGLYSGSERKKKIIVSLTSYPKRFETISIALKSLLLQTVKPDKIIVYLGNDTLPDDITTDMKEMENYGVEYRIDSTQNLMAHKKYFYAMQDYPNDIVVTADDDLYYPLDWLESLVKAHDMNPKVICARRVHLMKANGLCLEEYNHWEDQCRRITEPSYALFATSGSGKLFPPGSLCKEAFNTQAIKDLCLKADDIWLKCMEVLSGTPVMWVKNWEVDQMSVDSIQSIQEGSLAAANVEQCGNDAMLYVVMKQYGIKTEDFFREYC